MDGPEKTTIVLIALNRAVVFMALEQNICIDGPEQNICIDGPKQNNCINGPERNICIAGLEQNICIDGPKQNICINGQVAFGPGLGDKIGIKGQCHRPIILSKVGSNKSKSKTIGRPPFGKPRLGVYNEKIGSR